MATTSQVKCACSFLKCQKNGWEWIISRLRTGAHRRICHYALWQFPIIKIQEEKCESRQKNAQNPASKGNLGFEGQIPGTYCPFHGLCPIGTTVIGIRLWLWGGQPGVGCPSWFSQERNCPCRRLSCSWTDCLQTPAAARHRDSHR